MRSLICCDDAETGRRIHDVLLRHAVELAAEPAVASQRVVDRVSHTAPELVVLALPEDPAASLATLREIKGIAPHTHLLVVGPTLDAKMVLQFLRDGADEFLDETALDSEMAGALIRLKARASASAGPEHAGRVISVLGASGGSGCSILAANISVSLAQKGGKCALLDLRLAAGDLPSMLDLQPTHSLADLCDHLDRLDQGMFEQFFMQHPSGVAVLAAPSRMADIARVTGRGVRQTLAMARRAFPYVVIDVDRSFGDEQLEVLQQSDVLLLVLRPDFTSVRNTQRMLDVLRQLGVSSERVRLVANGYGLRKQLSIGQMEQSLHMKIVHTVPFDASAVGLTINKGTPLVLYLPRAKISRSLRDLSASVNGVH